MVLFFIYSDNLTFGKNLKHIENVESISATELILVYKQELTQETNTFNHIFIVLVNIYPFRDMRHRHYIDIRKVRVYCQSYDFIQNEILHI